VSGVLQLDDRGFILTGRDVPEPAWALQRPALPFGTSLPGVFAAGDVRCGSVKRVGRGRRGGSSDCWLVHQYLQYLIERGIGAEDDQQASRD
jgi:thioredoxin reductase (NADPH)